MSGSLLEVKKKMNGVKNTRKITKAMELVAASKMRQFQKVALSSRGYSWDLLNILKRNLKNEDNSLYTKKRESGKTLFVIYTSDKGLCGPLNTKLINALFRSEKWKDLSEDQRLLITVGKKSQTYANSHNIKVHKHFSAIPEKLTSLDAIKVVEPILELWQKGHDGQEIKEVIFVSPHYKNSFTFYPTLKTFLPFSQKTVESTLGADPEEKPEEASQENQNHFMIFEPSEEVVLQRLYEQLIQAMFIQSFLELKAAEYSSRMIAMQNATESATNMINDLKRIYNKARQQAITQEIAELIGASMALEDAA